MWHAQNRMVWAYAMMSFFFVCISRFEWGSCCKSIDFKRENKSWTEELYHYVVVFLTFLLKKEEEGKHIVIPFIQRKIWWWTRSKIRVAAHDCLYYMLCTWIHTDWLANMSFRKINQENVFWSFAILLFLGINYNYYINAHLNE